jgi:D-alanyl-D-alanine carboxypeptidase
MVGRCGRNDAGGSGQAGWVARVIWISLTALLVGLAGCDGDGLGPAPTLEERLDVALATGFAATDGIGYAASVWIPGRPVWTGVAGVSHGNVAVTPTTAFAAGSITKTFTAVTLLRLAEEGLVGLDDSLHAWFPPLPHTDPDITIRQLLNHTSGLSDFTDPPGWLTDLWQDADRIWDMQDYYFDTIREPYFQKGTTWSYSTSGYLLLRRVIEMASGRSLAEAYHHYVIDPLGLEHTYVCPEDPHPTDRAHGWIDYTGDGVYDDITAFSTNAFCSAAGGQIYSTSADLVTLGRALMRDRTPLQSASYQAMTDLFTGEYFDEPMVQGYGLGLMVFSPAFIHGIENVWGHGGNAPGYAAGMLYLADYDVVVGLTDNTEDGMAMTPVMSDLLDVILDALDRDR